MARIEERDLPTSCTDCRRDIGVDDSRAFEAGAGVILCWECALKRGGTFDARQERWTVPPDVSSLPDERRRHP